MRKYLFQTLIITLLFLFTSISSNAQKRNTLAFGLNITNFSDWKEKPLNLFNPEIIYLRQTNKEKQYSISFDVFYGEFPKLQKAEIGSITYRLNFSLKANYLLTKNNTSIGIGPSLRYRNEMKILYFYPPVNPFESVHDPNRSHYDIGINASLLHNFIINKNANILMKLSYSLHNKGRNPLSFGIFYGWDW